MEGESDPEADKGDKGKNKNDDVNVLLKRDKDFTSFDYRWIKKTLTKIESGLLNEKVVCGRGLDKPEGGHVIAYRKQNADDQSYKADGYHFWNRKGAAYAIQGQGIKKQRFQLQESTRNKTAGGAFNIWKMIWTLETPVDKSHSALLIHYTGDTQLYKEQPHGNSKKKVGFYRTNPQLPKSLQKEAARHHSKPVHIYEEAQIEANKSKDISMDPRNIQQVYNAKRHVSNSLKLTSCEISSLLQMSKFDVGKFVRIINLHPEESVVFAEPALLTFTKKLLDYSNLHPELKQVLNYDTTFEVGDFYVSILVCRNVLVENDRIFPVAVLVHERKTVECHQTLWKFLEKELDLNVLKQNIPVCVDREKALQIAIRSVCPDANIIFCENHILTDVKRFVSECAGKTMVDMTILCNDIKGLIASELKSSFDNLYEKCASSWSKEFKSYIEDNIIQDIRTSARYNTKRFSAFDNCAVTNNLSESLNFVMKNRADFKESRLDLFAMHVFKWQCSYLRNFSRGEKGKGDFLLKSSAVKLLPMLPSYINYTETDVVDECKNAEGKINNNETPANSYKLELAKMIIKGNLLSFDCQQQCWIVRHPINNELHTVDIIRDKENLEYKCSCSHPPVCVHITTVALATKQELTENIRTVQLHSLIRNKRKHKSGRKFHSKRNDVIVLPAPDSIAAKERKKDNKLSNKKIKQEKYEDTDVFSARNKTESPTKPPISPNRKLSFSSIPFLSPDIENTETPRNNVATTAPVNLPGMKKTQPIRAFLNQKMIHSEKKCRDYLKSSAKTLQGTVWLSGEVIDSALRYFIYEGFCNRVGYVCDAGFQTALVEREDPSSFMLQFSSDHQLLNKDMVFVNCIVDNNHWVLGIIFFDSAEIYILDPFHKNHSKESRPRKEAFLALVKIAEAARYVGNISKNIVKWKAVYATDIPDQLDGHECGVIECIFAFAILNKCDFPTTQDLQDYPRNRNWILQHFINYHELPDKTKSLLENPKSIRLPRNVRVNWKTYVRSIAPPEIICSSAVNRIMEQFHCIRTSRECYASCSVKIASGNYVFCVNCRIWFHSECTVAEDAKQFYFVCSDCKS